MSQKGIPSPTHKIFSIMKICHHFSISLPTPCLERFCTLSGFGVGLGGEDFLAGIGVLSGFFGAKRRHAT